MLSQRLPPVVLLLLCITGCSTGPLKIEIPKQYLQKGYLGVILEERVFEEAGDTVTQLNVIKVVDGSPAKQAGIQVGDIISTLNGRSPESLDKAKAFTFKFTPEQTVRVELRREDKAIAVDVQLMHYKDYYPLQATKEFFESI